MTKHILTVGGTLLAFSIAAFAGPLNTKGIPANAQGVVHIDLDAGNKSPVVKTVLNDNIGGADIAKLLKELKADAGIDPAKDINDITLGFFAGATADDEVQVIAVARGNFSPVKVFAALKKENPGSQTVTIGKHTFFSPKATGDATGARQFIGVLDGKTIVLAESVASATAAVAAYNGTAKSYAQPTTLVAFGRQVGAPVVLAYADGKIIPADATAGAGLAPPASVYFALGDDGQNVKLRLTTDQATAEEAQKVQTSVQGLLGFVQMMTANTNGTDGKPDPKKVADAAKVAKFLGALKFSTSGKSFNFGVDYPTVEVVQALKEKSAAK